MNIGHVTPANNNLFEELGVRDAINEELRVKLLVELNNWFQASGLTQTQAAKIVGVAQPTFNNALKYHFEKFKVDRLLSMIGRTGQPFQLLFGEDAARWKAQQKAKHQKNSDASTLC